jgi:hypothetical protein
LYGGGNRFGIYQIPEGIEAARDFRFASMKELTAHGLTAERINYELVYTAPFSEKIGCLTEKTTILNKIYEDFNINSPADFMGHSLSVGDVIVLKYNGDISSHFVDSVGFVELYAFLGEETPKVTLINTTVQNKETEKSETYSQVGNTSTDKRPTASKGKPTLMERLESNKQKASKQGQTDEQKSKQREV